MKTVGTTVDGKYLVEMSQIEHFSFIELENSIDKEYDFYDGHGKLVGKDLAPIFLALQELAKAKMSINSLKDFLGKLDKAFGNITGG